MGAIGAECGAPWARRGATHRGLHVLEMLQQRFRRSLSSVLVFALETPLSREYESFPAKAAS